MVGTPTEVAAALPAPRGEFTLVISGLAASEGSAAVNLDALVAVGREAGLSDRSVADLLRAAGIGRREAYARAQTGRGRSSSR